ncbi:MAG: hypothetical protein DRN30_02160 [Thermoplasmata archaeon]|nr:MAG: hypothetical protein DRN30_02160 [Thermoplasmata archaeon]
MRMHEITATTKVTADQNDPKDVDLFLAPRREAFSAVNKVSSTFRITGEIRWRGKQRMLKIFYDDLTGSSKPPSHQGFILLVG